MNENGTGAHVAALPRWDMSVVYPSLESPEFAADFADVVESIAVLGRLFDALGIAKREPQPLDDETVQAFERATEVYNGVLERLMTLGAYIGAYVSTNTRDTLAQARQSELQQRTVPLAQLGTRFTAWIGSLDVEALIARSEVARAHAFALRQAAKRAAHLMSPAEEALAAELNVSAGTAWAKLHGNVSSQISVPVELGGETRELPMSAVRNLAYDRDREVRRRAYEAELAGWERAAVPLAAALNGIKGQVNTLARRRDWESPLDAAIFDASIDRQTLDAMMTAAHESFPDFRRYLHAKARTLGIERLAWYDVFAPVGGGGRAWSFDEAAAFVVEQFGTYSQKMSDFAARAFRERWIDAEPRPGKQDGAYCMPLRRDESRVFANFKPSYGGMSTLAHELGHGYHNTNLAQRTMLQRQTPMTLAETASIFCETIVRQAALKQADRDEQVEILEASLQGSCQVVVDITSRFLFEQRVFAGRQERELSVDELNALMLAAQRETYGNGLDESMLHPYMWAVKGHYYSVGRSFYNFPYMFGLLFGLGLYARYQQNPDEFTRGYDELLSATGMADAAELAARFGIDTRTPDFWRASLALVKADVDRFEALVG
ncbi:MAG TPA: M3 family oligoendopeptidase [Ktedonobacterales bacterium]|nr:M3 family oligoendopeptidase [Ktedonobacterales bacterium]